jgi:hypothetical protein
MKIINNRFFLFFSKDTAGINIYSNTNYTHINILYHMVDFRFYGGVRTNIYINIFNNM